MAVLWLDLGLLYELRGHHTCVNLRTHIQRRMENSPQTGEKEKESSESYNDIKNKKQETKKGRKKENRGNGKKQLDVSQDVVISGCLWDQQVS